MATRQPDNAGLCTTCAFSRIVESARGSRFYMCRRSETDARFWKYPPLPVLECPGYDPGVEKDTESQPDHGRPRN